MTPSKLSCTTILRGTQVIVCCTLIKRGVLIILKHRREGMERKSAVARTECSNTISDELTSKHRKQTCRIADTISCT